MAKKTPKDARLFDPAVGEFYSDELAEVLRIDRTMKRFAKHADGDLWCGCVLSFKSNLFDRYGATRRESKTDILRTKTNFSDFGECTPFETAYSARVAQRNAAAPQPVGPPH
jgi:hypothetical protein